MRGRAALHSAHAEIRRADAGADDQFRPARLGDRQGAGLSLPGDASRHRPAVAGDAAAACWSCGSELTGYPAPPEACLVNLYEGDARMGLHVDSDEEAWDAPVLSISLGDTALFRIGGALRSDPDAQRAARLGRCVHARRAEPARLSRRRPHPAGHLAAVAERRADQSHGAAGDAALMRQCARRRSVRPSPRAALLSRDRDLIAPSRAAEAAGLEVIDPRRLRPEGQPRIETRTAIIVGGDALAGFVE